MIRNKSTLKINNSIKSVEWYFYRKRSRSFSLYVYYAVFCNLISFNTII